MSASERRVVWIVGAGSGMGRAAAEELSRTGWTVVASGRRVEAIEETARRARDAGGTAHAVSFDIALDDAHAAVDAVLAKVGRIDGIVLAAGLNSPHRTWSDQNAEDLESIIQVNLLGIARTLTAAFPALQATAGVAVVISSYAGWAHQPSAGVAYSASKTALGPIVRSLNAQGARYGVRACHLCPGDVDSDFLRMRPTPPTDADRAAMLTPSDIGRTVAWIMNSPAHVRVDELVISPVSQT